MTEGKKYLKVFTKGDLNIGNYTVYHLHSDDSLLDSATRYEDYIKMAVEYGQTAIASTEHGKPLQWVRKKMACDKAGIKFMHGVEIYLTEDLENKQRDNYHTVLIAKNLEGIKELNRLVSVSCRKDHFYYTNRISFDEFLNISDNILSTSACLASPLRRLPREHPYYDKLVRKYDFLEVQPHEHPDQIEFNKTILQLSGEFNKPIIAGTDTHSSTKYKEECRAVMLSAKKKSYGDEDTFDLTFKSYDEIVEAFKNQGVLSVEEYMQAIENTNVLADMCENFVLDMSIKYPVLYGSREKDDEVFTELVEQRFKDKLEKGVIPKEQEKKFREAIDEEMTVFRELEMTGFMLSMSELVSWCKGQGFAIGTARGSVGGSRVAYVTDIIDLNPETWQTIFSRFCNRHRVEVGDIDIDVVDTDRPEIFRYIVERFGKEKTARVSSFGTIQEKGVIDDVGRHLAKKWVGEHGNGSDNPWSLSRISAIKKEYESNPEKTAKKYPELFYYMEGLLGIKVSQSVHPAGMVICPVSLDDNYGTFDKEGDECLFIDMDEAHDVGLVKYDFLVLKSVKVIRDCCKYLGRPYPKTHEIDFNDQAVWEDIGNNQATIFQFESKFAADSLKRFKPKSIFDMALVTAAVRPSGASYRDVLFKHEVHKNPSKLIDDLLKDNMGYLIFQEDIIQFLQQICGLDGGTADSVRRGIAKKKMEILEKYLPQIVDGYCSKSDQPREKAEEEVKEYLKIIEDASSYMFGKNHAIGYCLLGYYYGYFRHYHPLEFLTSYLNNAANDDDIKTGTAYAERIGIRVTMPKWGVSQGEYFYDAQQHIIAKGLSSIKYMSEDLGEKMYELAHSKTYTRFVDVLSDLNTYTNIDARQLDILIKIDFFSQFGNQRELLRLTDMYYGMFKRGMVKQIKKELVDGSVIGGVIQKYAVSTTKSGAEAKSYTILDINSILREVEDAVKSVGMQDLDVTTKIQNFFDIMGYLGYTTNNPEDRRKLYVMDCFDAFRKKDGKKFGLNITTKSIGSGVEARFTVFNRDIKAPISKGDILLCKSYNRDGIYFNLTDYEKIVV